MFKCWSRNSKYEKRNQLFLPHIWQNNKSPPVPIIFLPPTSCTWFPFVSRVNFTGRFCFLHETLNINFIENSISNTNMFMFVIASFVNYLGSISRNLNTSKLKKEAVYLIFQIIKENLNALLLEQWTGPPDMFTCNDYVMRASHATELFVTYL